jgi:hypothetical protein
MPVGKHAIYLPTGFKFLILIRTRNK